MRHFITHEHVQPYMSKNEFKHVQTELTEDEYERLRKFASEQGMSLKEAGREALVSWIERQQQADPNDPAFTVLNELKELSGPESVETDAPSEEDLVEGWHGDDVEFTLTENPADNP